ncbi:hypothetical protein CPC08DRAFT_748880 [Agrocybe pediades]|nr:hypothetical protein CPC08DRAFT_748880 [Agrocybe pediades]
MVQISASIIIAAAAIVPVLAASYSDSSFSESRELSDDSEFQTRDGLEYADFLETREPSLIGGIIKIGTKVGGKVIKKGAGAAVGAETAEARAGLQAAKLAGKAASKGRKVKVPKIKNKSRVNPATVAKQEKMKAAKMKKAAENARKKAYKQKAKATTKNINLNKKKLKKALKYTGKVGKTASTIADMASSVTSITSLLQQQQQQQQAYQNGQRRALEDEEDLALRDFIESYDDLD